ncbi:hypothetical protein [Paenibacillus periandrae]|uniref:hypothetical protein n=1 Tax=Paenibacillus periandrae TaxID=1761741 RepID=UPI001F09F769|nr:hypothetical protein [Paenibacillus periandrae]
MRWLLTLNGYNRPILLQGPLDEEIVHKAKPKVLGRKTCPACILYTSEMNEQRQESK